jgi:putative transcriptional regulator
MNEKDPSFSTSLKGQLLVAMPQMSDPRFHRATIFVCVHDEKGAMGISINQPLGSIDFVSLLNQLGVVHDKPLSERIKNLPVLTGGPVEGVRGFLLHSHDFHQKDTIIVDEQFSISGTVDSLRAVVNGTPPEHMIFTLGYAGWGAGQLEREIQDNAWLTVPATYDLVFRTSFEEMWEKAFATLGINPSAWSGLSGRA